MNWAATRRMCGKTMLFLTVMAAGLLVCIDAAVTQPCDFLSSINITDGQRNATDQSIEYRGITFAPDQYGEFDFVLVNGTKRTPVAKHLRGCPCLKKPCIRLYCLPGRDSRGRRGCNYEAMTTNHTINILDENNHNKSVNIVEHFSYVVDRPCETFVIQPSGEWQLKHVSSRDNRPTSARERNYHLFLSFFMLWCVRQTGEVIYDSDLIRDYKGYTIDLFYNERTQSSMAKLLLCRVNPKVNIRFIVLPIGINWTKSIDVAGWRMQCIVTVVICSSIGVGGVHIDDDCRLRDSTGSTEPPWQIFARLLVQFAVCLHRIGGRSNQRQQLRAAKAVLVRWQRDLLWILIGLSLDEYHQHRSVVEFPVDSQNIWYFSIRNRKTFHLLASQDDDDAFQNQIEKPTIILLCHLRMGLCRPGDTFRSNHRSIRIARALEARHRQAKLLPERWDIQPSNLLRMRLSPLAHFQKIGSRKAFTSSFRWRWS